MVHSSTEMFLALSLGHVRRSRTERQIVCLEPCASVCLAPSKYGMWVREAALGGSFAWMLATFDPLALLSCIPDAGKIREEAPEIRRPLGDESGNPLAGVSPALPLLAGCTTWCTIELLSGFSANEWVVGGINSHICHRMVAQSATGEESARLR